ncbi:MAG: hypothetical protein C4527_19310 [Candidatus Omnitrophota bacterium]|nr:MAG: hypothetical protein C4527_19310 [Candidatus Omnitrophota bacterium]
MIQALHENILDLLKERYILIPDAIEKAVYAIHEVTTLKMLLKKAAMTPSLEKFLNFLENR